MIPVFLGRRAVLRPIGVLAIGLVALTALAYLPLVHNGFVILDDPGYITENPRLPQGLTADNLRWAFTTSHMGNWHPVTWITLLIDGRLYGLNPVGYHATNLLLHLATTLLMFLVLRGMTGALWRSALVAALFALHPLHVESVAWASERKDVLAGFFWLLALAAYLRYVRRPGVARYLPLLGCLVLGLMSKALLVTLPFALLLLDFWPLGRWRSPGARGGGRLWAAGRLLLEKAPLLALAAAASVVAYFAQQQVGAVMFVPENTFAVRAGRAMFSYFLYLQKTFWPVELAVFYPYHMPGRSFPFTAGAVLLVATIISLLTARARPYLIFGWLWFLGTLVPMIGIVQIGGQGIADRYTYIPLTGIFVLGAWGVAALAQRSLSLRRLAGAGGAILLLALAGVSFRQVGYWRSTVTLFRHALAVSPDNYNTKVVLGLGLTREGKLEEANEWFRSALKINPNLREVNYFIGLNLYRRGRRREAANHLLEEVRIDPANPRNEDLLASILEELGRFEEAKRHHRQVSRLDHGAPRGRGDILARSGRHEEAVAAYRAAIRAEPGNYEAWNNLGCALSDLGRKGEAAAAFEETLRLKPDHPTARHNLAAVGGSGGRRGNRP